MEASPSSAETNCPMRHKEKTSNREELATPLLGGSFCQRDSAFESLKEQQKTSEPVLEGAVEKVKLPEMMFDAV